MADEETGDGRRLRLVLVARKGGFGLPTACPACLPVYVSLRLANAHFDLQFDSKNPDSDHLPFVEFGDYVAYNCENGGVIDKLKEDGILDLDSSLPSESYPDWLSTKAMINSWLADAALYELWIESDGSAADAIYFSDLPWPIRKALHWKRSRAVKNVLGITKLNAAEREDEIYRKAKQAYEALSSRLGDEKFFFENRPTSLDAFFLSHALFVLQTSPETSALRKLLSSHDNLLRYAENLKRSFLEAGPSSSSSSTSSASAKASSRWTWSSKTKAKQKRERTEEEKAFRRRAKYFLLTQLVSVVVFLTLLGPIAAHEELEMEDDDDDMSYDY